MKDRAELLQSIEALMDRRLSPDEAAALKQRLRDDPEARALYVHAVDVRASLRWRFNAPAAQLATPMPPARVVNAGGMRLHTLGLALAAALAVAAAVIAIYFIAVNGDNAADPDPAGPPIATLIDATDSVFVNDDLANPGSEYARGAYSIDAGSAEFLLRNRVTVNLHGKTRLRVDSPSHVYLAEGEAEFRVPTGAVGFTVDMPDRSRIVDLGTAFRVDIDEDGRASVRVTEGKVSWRGAGPDAEPVVLSQGQVADIVDGRIHVGWSVRPDHPLRHTDATTGIDWIVLNGHHRGDAFGTIEKTDGFKHSVDGGFNGRTSHHAGPGDGTEQFTWTLHQLDPGAYELAATWKSRTKASRAPFFINDGSAVLVDQSQAPQGPPTLREKHRETDFAFQVIASDVVVDETGTLTVRLTNASEDRVVADAIAVRLVQPRSARLDRESAATEETGDGPHLTHNRLNETADR